MKKHQILKLMIPAALISIAVLSWIMVLGGINISMSGLQPKAEKPTFSIKTLLSGEYQQAFEEYFDDAFPVKNVGIKLKSTLEMMVLKQSPVTKYKIGKNNSLNFHLYLNEYKMIGEEFDGEHNRKKITSNIEDLAYIQNALEESGKDCYTFITPAKAYFDSENILDKYNLVADPDGSKSTYEVLLETFDENEIKYFDSYKYFTETELPMSVFPSTGIHWRKVAGNYAFEEFIKVFNENSIYKLPEIIVTEPDLLNTRNIGMREDTDIYDRMNSIRRITDIVYQDDNYYHDNNFIYKPVLTEDLPSMSIQGASFTGPVYPIFMNSEYMEHLTIVTGKQRIDMVDDTIIFEDYKDLDIEKYLQNDIIIFEVNQSVSNDMSFGFIQVLREYIETNGIPENKGDT